MSWPGHQTWLRHFVLPPPPPTKQFCTGAQTTCRKQQDNVGWRVRGGVHNVVVFISIPCLTTVPQQFCQQGSDIDQKVIIHRIFLLSNLVQIRGLPKGGCTSIVAL